MSNTERTYGEKAVGLNFNPSNDGGVQIIKENFATIIDHLNDLRTLCVDSEQIRLLSIAITESQTAQMWAVKAYTFNLSKECIKKCETVECEAVECQAESESQPED